MEKQIHYHLQPKTGLEIIHAENSLTSYPLHNHITTHVIGFLLKGEIILTHQKEKAVHGPGALFIILPYEPHAITAITPYNLLSICLHKNTLETSSPDELKKQVQRCLPCILPPGYPDEAGCKALENAIEAVCLSHQHHPRKTENRSVGLLRHLLESEPEKHLSIDEMAKAAFTSKYHFIRQFTKNAGLPPHHFRIQNRIRKARKMLPGTPSLTNVALASGFYDQSHFIRHFRKISGMTPREYLRAIRTLPE